jgi:hypothetical protein
MNTRLLRIAAGLVLAGLGVEAVSLQWTHPLAFILFAVVGAAAIGGGVLVYLYWLLFRRARASQTEAPS